MNDNDGLNWRYLCITDMVRGWRWRWMRRCWRARWPGASRNSTQMPFITSVSTGGGEDRRVDCFLDFFSPFVSFLFFRLWTQVVISEDTLVVFAFKLIYTLYFTLYILHKIICRHRAYMQTRNFNIFVYLLYLRWNEWHDSKPGCELLHGQFYGLCPRPAHRRRARARRAELPAGWSRFWLLQLNQSFILTSMIKLYIRLLDLKWHVI